MDLPLHWELALTVGSEEASVGGAVRWAVVVCGVDSVDSGASSSPELHILGRAGQGWSQPPVLIISGPMLPHTSLLTDQA